MLGYNWPPALSPLDVGEVKAAIAAQDLPRFLDAITGREIDEVLDEVAGGGALLHGTGRTDDTEAIAVSFMQRLSIRSAPGHKETADLLLTALRAGQ